MKRVFVSLGLSLAVITALLFIVWRENNSISGSEGESETSYVDTGFVATKPDSYDSADTPILIGRDTEAGTLTFLNLDVGKKYTLSYDGATKLYNKFGESISLSQIDIGDIVDVTFLKSKKRLTTMSVSSAAWHYDNVEKYEFNTVKMEVSIGDEIYKLFDNTQYLSQGRSIEEMELNAADILSFQGIDNTVLSVVVEKGHGYLRLANAESFVGGWIEIGQTQVQRITEDMLLTVPEGSYQVNISYKGSGGVKSVVINRDEETTLDIGDLKVEEPRTGTVLFSLEPSDAELYVDGTKVDASQPIVLEYGIHQLIARADGYQSLTQYLRVGEESAGISIVLDEENDADDESESSTEAAEDTETETVDTTTDYYKVYIDAPEDVEVYLDGSYVGISPCSLEKTSGSHVITLRKSGYTTRSYTVQIDEEDKDISYSFADLEVSSSDTVASILSEALDSLLSD
ncbi:MAG: PEGA domain-containing protein [Lachnospiraceae bacterium]|nr:PEGA domain-containing protein [Lachnospiraceae bacterium]